MRLALCALILIISAMTWAVILTPECPTEDSSWCVWTAKRHGGGLNIISLWDGAYIRF